MSRLLIRGGKAVSGTHRVSGNKNAALPMIAASLLTSEPVTLHNLPAIADVDAMLEVAIAAVKAVCDDTPPRKYTIKEETRYEYPYVWEIGR